MKQLLLNLFEFYIQASIHVALSVVSLLFVFTLSQGLLTDQSLVFTLFFGTITGYNFVKYASVAKLHHRSLTRSLRIIQVFSLISFLLMCIYAMKLPLRTIVAFAGVGVLTFLYAVPLVASKNMRSVSGIKIYLVAICWGLSVVVVPAVHYNIMLEGNIILKMIQIICLIIALIIPFDIRDLAYDKIKLMTIPQQLGIMNSKTIAIILLFIFCGLEFYIRGAKSMLYLLPMCITTSGLILFISVKTTSKYYCSFWIESMPIVYGLTIVAQLV